MLSGQHKIWRVSDGESEKKAYYNTIDKYYIKHFVLLTLSLEHSPSSLSLSTHTNIKYFTWTFIDHRID